MRVLSCKIHCPSSFICFCKPSSAHLYNSGPLKLQNSPHLPPTHHLPPPLQQIQVQEEEDDDDDDDGKKQQQQQKDATVVLRSCIKKDKKEVPCPPPSSKKKVQWVDSVGKQLVHIKEFESSETGDTDNEEDNGGCLCNIL